MNTRGGARPGAGRKPAQVAAAEPAIVDAMALLGMARERLGLYLVEPTAQPSYGELLRRWHKKAADGAGTPSAA